MTFEIFDDLRLWADTLQDNLVCSRFFASLCSAPKSSRLHFYASSPAVFSTNMEPSVPNLLDSNKLTLVRSLASAATSASSTYYSYLSGLLSRVIHHHHHHSGNSNGFLHVTIDRLLFITISQGRKPALIASWNFTNGEISIYGTGRVSSTSGDSGNKVFYLIEAAGRYLFACDKATELSIWIQRATRPASYLYERRWLSSVASQLGEDQAILLMPFDGDRERKVVDVSLRNNSKFQMDGSQQAPSARHGQNDSPVSVYIHQVHERVSYRTRMRFLSHPTDQPVLSTRQLHKGRQQDDCALRRSYSNISTIHDANHHNHRHTLAECFSSDYGTDQQTPAMVALSPLPLDNLPHSAADEAKLGSDVDAESGEHSAAITAATIDSNRSSATSSSPLFSQPSPSSMSEAQYRSTRSRLSNSWSTCLSHYPSIPSTSPSFRGVRAMASSARASSECRYCSGVRGQQWRRRMRRSLLVGVTCSVPWDAAATSEKPRTGRLYSSRHEIREAALKAVTTGPLSSLPSAGTFSFSGSFSEQDDDDDVDNLATSGGQEHAFNSADAASQTTSHSSPPPTSPPSAPPSSKYYVNLEPNSPSSLSDGSSAHQMAAMITAIASTPECASPATDFTIAAPPSAVEWGSRSANYLSYTPYVPLLRQGSDGGRIRTLSSGQPSVSRNPLLLTPHPIYDGFHQSPCLSAHTLGSLPLTPPPTDMSDVAKLTGLQSQRSHGPPKRLQDDFDSSAVYRSTEAISLAEAVMGNDGGSSGNRSTVGKLHSNYVVIDLVEGRSPSRRMQHVSTAAQNDNGSSNISGSNTNSANSSLCAYADHCFPKVV